MHISRLLINCPDQPGIVATVSSFLSENGANIIQSDQYSTDFQQGCFFMRIEFCTKHKIGYQAFKNDFRAIADKFQMDWHWHDAAKPKRLALLVSKSKHCLLDLLWRQQAGELGVEFPVIISNHPDAKSLAQEYGIDFWHLPVTADNKLQQEKYMSDKLRELKVDGLILARYMQILSDNLIDTYPYRIINIHHSFLPAFAGAKPYEQARDRGVKIIGATAHYATATLDDGPIIEQDVIRVSHKDDLITIKQKGQDIERTVLSRAVRWHAEDRVLVFNNRTIVFT